MVCAGRRVERVHDTGIAGGVGGSVPAADRSGGGRDSGARELEGVRRGGHVHPVSVARGQDKHPARGIRSTAEAVEDGVVEDDAATVRRHRTGLRREADRFTGILDDLFELSRISTSALRRTLQEILLAEVVSDAVALATPVPRPRGCGWLATPLDGLPSVAGGLPELGRVPRNLLSNAICTPRPTG